MKSAEIVLRTGAGKMRDSDGGENKKKIHCKHICKCHNETSPL
jgi:hypothetical protein